MADQSEVLLIRHGETHGYHGDVGLTEVGEGQSRDKGAELAGRLTGSGSIVMLHAPTARSTATAVALRAALVDGLGSADRVGPLAADVRFDSMQFMLGERAVESTNVAVARSRLPDDDGRLPDWATEYDRFAGDRRVDARLAGPIDRWLVSTTTHMEPPQIAVYRLWAGVSAVARAAGPGGSVLVITHSGPMRAFVTAALGRDPGEPHNLEHIGVRLRADDTAELDFREHRLNVEVPTTAPPWLSADYLSGDRAGRPMPS